jgi:chromosome segregation ATPase
MNLKNLVIYLFCLFLWSCSENNEKVELLASENAALKHNTKVKDSLLVQYFSTIDEIEQNLAHITQSENSIVLNLQQGIENKKSKKKLIIDEIQFINSLLENNKEKINSLTQQLANSNYKIVELQNVIERLSQKVLDQDHNLMLLKSQLVKKDFAIDLLNHSLDSLSFLLLMNEELIDMQQEELQTAYYCFGTKKELKNKGVITGEILSKSKKLSTDFNKSYFRKIDISKTYSIPLAVKKAKLITNHPTESYKLIENKTIDKLLITNPIKFWEASKYLVIVVE